MKIIGVIGAMPIEIKLIKEKLNIIDTKEYAGFKFYIGTMNNLKVILTSCSVGKVNAASCTQILIDKFDVTHIINTGIAGSLKNDVKICDIVISDNVTHHDVRKKQMKEWYPNQEYFETDLHLVNVSIEAFNKLKLEDISYHKGRIVSGEAFICDNNIKDKIISEYEPCCVEMEGSAIGHVAHMNKIPFIIIRSISDNADEEANIKYNKFEELASINSAKLVYNMLLILSDSVFN
ncbi:5'-methylthioadenosine/adenosylhomocysteine nucleosidase [Romboutsia sp.]|uniref:5'-methylthioadenosine/adenosylhomocysteine nucleosidase n=1 Tax=Romboutsia sp. TaxID=1965302 RepID=UPI003F403657